MKLVDLEARFLKITEPGHYLYVDSLADAQGVMFLCPACFQAHGGAVGTHMILCWFSGRGVSDTETPGPGRWAPTGTGIDDLTLRPSVLITKDGGCVGWHGFVTHGDAA